jgi:hypothetical protein
MPESLGIDVIMTRAFPQRNEFQFRRNLGSPIEVSLDLDDAGYFDFCLDRWALHLDRHFDNSSNLDFYFLWFCLTASSEG